MRQACEIAMKGADDEMYSIRIWSIDSELLEAFLRQYKTDDDVADLINNGDISAVMVNDDGSFRFSYSDDFDKRNITYYDDFNDLMYRHDENIPLFIREDENFVQQF